VILVDTHTLLWMDNDDPSLGRRARALIDAALADGVLAVSAISFWECSMLHKRRRVRLPKSCRAWRSDLLAAGLLELPLDGEVADAAARLSDLPKNPAGRFIVATAIKQRATLLTADRALLRWKGALRCADAGR
jgi:PIN domain nuclease of toxin-antitoxin system